MLKVKAFVIIAYEQAALNVSARKAKNPAPLKERGFGLKVYFELSPSSFELYYPNRDSTCCGAIFACESMAVPA